MHKSETILTMTDDKGKTLFELKGRRSKVIRTFMTTAIQKVWVLKWDLFETFKNTVQFKNIWEYLEASKKAEKEKEMEE